MKNLLLTCVFISSILASDLPQEFDGELYEKGEKIFENKCMECHQKSMPIPLLMKNFIEENNKTLKLKAPTGNEISFRLKQQIGSREDIEFHLHQTNDFLKDYLYNPDLSKTICLEGVIRHFKVMPSMKGKITENEIEEVNYFLYFLEGFNGVNEFYFDETKF
ncbi:hypothetical protein CKA55_01890 [Arcobacter suis]|uniref:Cytochrome c domain-containing protein n=1 Tax=Arcobacter suis CECT 7833 TaxID=663365 RepID=A0AAD0SNC4_9BACT|nr:hypothetical protein [Arcobacter suis]AXX88585.1 hypothetical protein ASUIS_0067 [Arcobacter suis CECT 7833]RWS47583.1 hypothetical protein CKA55_01890 [Arcobacter suis]